jgi:hypothetical protein
MAKQKKVKRAITPIDWDTYHRKQDASTRAKAVGRTITAAEFGSIAVPADNIELFARADADRFERSLECLKTGDLSLVQEILLGQLISLDAAYQRSVRRASYDRALELQKASVKTARALADITRPKKVTFVKTQQNLAMMQPAQAQQQLVEAQGVAIEDPAIAVPVSVSQVLLLPQ